MKSTCSVLLCLVLVLPVFSQDNITERVTVDWWVLPIFAVDGSGNSILDLQKNDIVLKINNREIDRFFLYKQAFSDMKQKVIQKNPVERKKMIFLLFDSTLSTSSAIERSKTIARQIVDSAESGHQYIIMNIEPFTGLKFVGGPIRERARVSQLIKEKIKGGRDLRIQNLSDFFASTSGKKAGKYSGQNLGEVIRPGAERFTKYKSMTFFQSFQLLYFALNSIKDNKFIYLFTEGVSKITRTSGKHMESSYRQYLQEMAGYLGRSGAVLFIINPSGTVHMDLSMSSGEDSLQFLAGESGGRYLQGSNDKIRAEIESLHRAYYEIAFPDVHGAKGISRRITVKSKRPGVSIHTLRSLEKNKRYSDMNQLEKEILALNLLSQNSISKIGLAVENIQITEKIRKKNHTVYTIVIPQRMIRRQVDLFRIWVDQQTRDTIIEKQTVVPELNRMDILLDEKKGNESYFVLIDGSLALAPGITKTSPTAVPEKRPEEVPLPQDSPEPVPVEKIVYDKQMTRMLIGVADYCRKLQDSAFYFICKEKVVEIREVLDATYRGTQGRNYGDRYIAREGMDTKIKSQKRIENRYLFDYQLIKKEGKISEQRQLLKGKKNDTGSHDIESRMKTFISKKIVLAPILLLSQNWQSRYRYELTGQEKIKGVRMLVLQATPLYSDRNEFLFGTIWVDPRDFSVRKIKVNPQAIHGYTQLQALAKKLRAKLTLSAEIDFNKMKDGIRFPSEVTVIENYRGGPLINRLRGRKGWNRSKTVYSYKDYRFFNVQTDVLTD